MPSLRATAVAFVSAAALSACGGSSPVATQTTPPTGAKHHIEISNFSYHPPTITVHVGARITLTNRDQTAHTATATNGAFDTGTLRRGASRTLTFTKPGVYRYYCQFHAFMRGEIVVK